MEIENGFEYGKIVDILPVATTPVPKWPQAAIVSERGEAGCAIQWKTREGV